MLRSLVNRRRALQALGAMVIATVGAPVASWARPPVKWSSGTERPRSEIPPDATDCHHHIYDARYPVTASARLRPGDALVADYLALQQRLGIGRNVIVQPSTYGIDSRLLVESIAALGAKNTRAVAVIDTSVTDPELRQLHQAGVRGIRFNLAQPGATTIDMVRPLAKQIAHMGWHVEVNASAQDLLDTKAVWSDLPCRVVFDHLGHVPEPNAINHPAFAMIRELVQQDRAWVKLSAFYSESKVGPPSYIDSVLVASVYAKEGPDRMVWGSNWPHPSEKDDNKPDDALLLDLLSECAPNEVTRIRILVDNPAKLYQFV